MTRETKLGERYSLSYTNPERKVIRQKVVEMIIGGKSRSSIDKMLEEKFDVKDKRYKQMYFLDGRRYIAKTYLEEPEVFRAKQLAILEEMIDNAVETGDKKTILQCLEMQNKLLSAYVERKEVKVDTDTFKLEFT